MKKTSLLATSIILLSMMNISCLGILHGKAKGMAFIEISDTTELKAAAAAKKVFLDNAYVMMQEKPGLLVFEKPGSRMQDISYGGVSDDGVWVKAVLTIQKKAAASAGYPATPIW